MRECWREAANAINDVPLPQQPRKICGKLVCIMCPPRKEGGHGKCRRDEVHVWSKKEERNSKETKGGVGGGVSHISRLRASHIMDCLAYFSGVGLRVSERWGWCYAASVPACPPARPERRLFPAQTAWYACEAPTYPSQAGMPVTPSNERRPSPPDGGVAAPHWSTCPSPTGSGIWFRFLPACLRSHLPCSLEGRGVERRRGGPLHAASQPLILSSSGRSH